MNGEMQFGFREIVLSILVLAAFFVVNHLIGVNYRNEVKRTRSKDGGYTTVVMNLMRFLRALLVILAVVLILKINGISLTTVGAFLSIISAIIGLAIQDMLKDIVNGIHLIHDDYFEIGDTIIFENRVGLVTMMTSRSVTLLDVDTKDTIVISNRNIDKIVRRSKLNDIDLQLSYEEDFKKVNEVLRITCDHISSISGIDDCVYKGVHNFGDFAITYKIRFYCEPSVSPELRRSALRIIQDDLKRADIKIPYPQVDIHHKDMVPIQVSEISENILDDSK